MATFNVEAMDAEWKRATLAIEAMSVQEAVVKARERRLFPISVREAGPYDRARKASAAPPVSLDSVPDGFALELDELGQALQVTYMSQGMVGTLRKVGLGLFLWTFSLVVAGLLLFGARMLSVLTMVFLAVLWASVGVFLVLYLVWHLFAKTLVVMGRTNSVSKRGCSDGPGLNLSERPTSG
jgi:hypothetical protein